MEVLVVNALRHETHLSHFNLEEALNFISCVKPKKAYLTHIAPDMGLHGETEKLLPKSVYISYDGLKINIDDS